VAYNGCPDLLARVKAEALTEATQYSSFPTTVPGGADLASGQATAGAAASSAAVAGPVERAAPAAPGATGYSTTNNQEAGADEPDMAKTNGRLMVVVRHQPYGIQVVDVASSRPRLAGFVALPQFESNAELFLVGGYAVAVDQQQSQSTHVTVISLADPDHPTVARSFSLEGDEVGARLIEGRIVLVLQSRPRVPLEPGAIRGSTLGDWVPNATTDCGTVFYPTTPSGLGTVSVVSLDPSSDQVGKGATIMGNASVVYASDTSVYLATQAWQAQQAAMQSGDARSVTTDIHGFDISDPTKPRYVGSGSVPGTLTDQYALSESRGYLRVATTVGQATPPIGERFGASGPGGAPTFQSDNMVTVLQPSAGRLAEVGRVGGLGRGEKIYGVRFVGDLGYVVTFRQTDPLYVLDLSDPHRPQLRGQLELTGFSTYLHPLGGGLLFGIGHGVDQYDRQNGIQLSVFDVSDPAHPSLKSRINLPGAFSSADSDHHAFLWWAPSRLVVVPIMQYLGGPFAGEVAFKVGSSASISEFGRIAQSMVGTGVAGGVASGVPGMTRPAGPGIAMAGPAVERALVVGDLLYTVSDQEIVASHLDSLREAARLTYQ
jgi:uncharacterized secreted protein with C-terminal beta-propeller domain